MKKFLYLIMFGALPILASAQPITSVNAGKDLAIRSLGGTATATLGPVTTTIPIPPSTLAHIVKAAGTLDMSFNLEALFPGLGISSVVTATGSGDTSNNTITWNITDPTVTGTTFKIAYGGSTYTVTVTGISGSIAMAPSALKTPVYDSFDSVYRMEALEPTSAVTSSLTISGTTSYYGFNVGVTIKFAPSLAGIGGTPPGNFVKQIGFANSSVLNGTSFSVKVALNAPAGAGGATVALSGYPFTVPTTVSFPAGAQAEFVTGSAPDVAVSTPGHISASYNGFYCDAAMTDYPLLAGLGVVTVAPIGGGPVEMRVNLYTAAPTGGAVINLRTDDPNVSIPATVTVPAGATYAAFTVYTKTPPTATSATLTTPLYVSANYGLATVRTAVALH